VLHICNITKVALRSETSEQQAADLLNNAFRQAFQRLVYSLNMPNPSDLRKFYKSVAGAARRLLKVLEYADIEVLLTGSPSQHYYDMTIGSPPAILHLKEAFIFPSWRDAVGSAAARLATSSISEAELELFSQQQGVPLDRIGPQARTGLAVDLMLARVPDIAAFLAAVAENGHRMVATRSDKTRQIDLFRRRLYEELAGAWYLTFGCPPRVKVGPEKRRSGPGAAWISQVLKLAKKKLQPTGLVYAQVSKLADRPIESLGSDLEKGWTRWQGQDAERTARAMAELRRVASLPTKKI
jgi:hypothetical protein